MDTQQIIIGLWARMVGYLPTFYATFISVSTLCFSYAC
jgi:hypothetical protein